MKGIMVGVLVMMMTGKVIGQHQNTENTGTSGLFILWLDDLQLSHLQSNQNGFKADVPDHVKGKLSSVFLRHEKFRTQFDRIGAVATPPGQFNMWINDNMVADLKKAPWALETNVPESLLDRDKIVKVVLKYGTAPQNVGSPAIPKTSGTNFGAPGPARDFPVLGQNKTTKIGSPTPFKEAAGDSSASFPPPANSIFNQTSKAPPSKKPQQSILGPPYEDHNHHETPPHDYQNQLGAPVAQNPRYANSDNSADFRSPTNTTGDLELKHELIRRERQKLEAARIAQDRRLDEQKIAQEQALLDNERYLQRRQFENRPTTSDAKYAQPRFASSAAIDSSSSSFQLPKRRTVTFAPQDEYDYDSPPSRQKLTTPPRIAENTKRVGNQNLRSGLTGDNGGGDNGTTTNTPLAGQEAHANKAYGFMFFMLMLSLGLNLYLAWISRGFYVRYNELADELRETFTTSV